MRTAATMFDTDAVSYRLKSDSRAESYRAVLKSGPSLVSFATRAELSLWAARRGWSVLRAAQLDQYLDGKFETVWPSQTVCHLWASVQNARLSQGRRMGQNDAWIAGCALAVGATLVTNNRKDFDAIEGLVLHDSSGETA